jgi:hypothetical protein
MRRWTLIGWLALAGCTGSSGTDAAAADRAGPERTAAERGGPDRTPTLEAQASPDLAVEPTGPTCPTGNANGTCDAGETCAGCPADCGPCCKTSAACSSSQCSEAGLCCTPPTDPSGQKYGGMTYTNWHFGLSGLQSVQLKICFLHEQTSSSGVYYQLYDFPIDGHGMYFGLQTAPSGRNTIFSQFGTTDATAIKEAPGGYHEVGTYEGPFISVRLKYAWGKGCYILRLARGAAEGSSDWFELYVRKDGSTADTFAGALRFARAFATVPATIEDGGGSWVEDFTPTTSIFQLPYKHITFSDALANGAAKALHAESSYSTRGNADVYWDGHFVHHESGQKTPRCHPAGSLF